MKGLPYPKSVDGLLMWAQSLVQKLQEPAADPVPPGAIMAFVGGNLPDGWLPCQGQVIKSSDYPGLYRNVGTAFNIGGEAAGSFRLPDGRGRTFIGAPSVPIARVGGGTITAANLPPLPITINDTGHRHDYLRGDSVDVAFGTDVGVREDNAGGFQTATAVTGITASISGVGANTPFLPAYFSGAWIIKT